MNLKSVITRKHLRDYSGLTIGVDASCWLHKGVYSCSPELCKGIPTLAYVDYCMTNVRTLLDHNIKLYIVFDGDALPMKKGTVDERRATREKNLARALEHEKLGETTAARKCYNGAVERTPEMGRAFMDALTEHRVPFVVAPYEADSQLAYMAHNNIIDVVLTEDSDLIAYGVKHVLFKWERDTLEGDAYCFDQIGACKKLDLAGLSYRSFLHMCILSGCDYLDSLPSIGMVNANKYVRRFQNMKTFFRNIRFAGKIKMPPGYEDNFNNAVLTFLYARVWCTKTHRVVHVRPLPDVIDPNKLSFLGPIMTHDVAAGIACGDLNPFTRKTMVKATGSKTVIGNGSGGERSQPVLSSARSNMSSLPRRQKKQQNVNQYLMPVATSALRKEFKNPVIQKSNTTGSSSASSSSSSSSSYSLGMRNKHSSSVSELAPPLHSPNSPFLLPSSLPPPQKRSGYFPPKRNRESVRNVETEITPEDSINEKVYESTLVSENFGLLTKSIRDSAPVNVTGRNVFDRYKRQKTDDMDSENRVNVRDTYLSPTSSPMSYSSLSSSIASIPARTFSSSSSSSSSSSATHPTTTSSTSSLHSSSPETPSDRNIQQGSFHDDVEEFSPHLGIVHNNNQFTKFHRDSADSVVPESPPPQQQRHHQQRHQHTNLQVSSQARPPQPLPLPLPPPVAFGLFHSNILPTNQIGGGTRISFANNSYSSQRNSNDNVFSNFDYNHRRND